MLARGLRIVKFHGRYFVYFNPYDGFPDGLGQSIVDEIPTDKREYHDWLERERNFHADLSEELETRVLSIKEESIQSLPTSKAEESAKLSPVGMSKQSQQIWQYMSIGVRELPGPFCDIRCGTWKEWTYLTDLDREIFVVNDWVYLNLWDIPRDRWTEPFAIFDKRDAYMEDSGRIRQEASKRICYPEYFGDRDDVTRRLQASYQEYQPSTWTLTNDLDMASLSSPRNVLAFLIFERLISTSTFNYWRHLTDSIHTDFGFREMAFAILSLAAGEFYFENPHRLSGMFKNSIESPGYLVDVQESSNRLFPIFGSGCHLQSLEPGSAPKDSIYWFEGVLISLVPDIVLKEHEDIVIAKTVEHALAEGKRDFQAVVFSFLNIILIHVSHLGGVRRVRHTDRVRMFAPLKMTDVSEGDTTPGGQRLNSLRRSYPAVLALQYIFNTHTTPHSLPKTRGRFPTEVYGSILDHVTDASTRNVFSKVSHTFRSLCGDCFFFNNNLTILSYKDSAAVAASDPDVMFREARRSQLHGVRNALGVLFEFRDESSGELKTSGFYGVSTENAGGWYEHRKEPGEAWHFWCPVFGKAPRVSIMTQVPFQAFV